MEKEFTKQAQQVLNKAKSLARRFHHPYIGTEHLLLALRQEFTGVAGTCFTDAGNKKENIGV